LLNGKSATAEHSDLLQFRIKLANPEKALRLLDSFICGMTGWWISDGLFNCQVNTQQYKLVELEKKKIQDDKKRVQEARATIIKTLDDSIKLKSHRNLIRFRELFINHRMSPKFHCPWPMQGINFLF